MANCLIAWPNRVDTAILAGSPWSSGLPVANLQNPLLTKLARTTGVGLFTPSPAIPDGSQCSAVVNINFTLNRYITAVALLRHNLSLSANVRVVIWQDAANTIPVYDSGWQPAWPRCNDTVTLRWNDSNFLFGRINLDDIGIVPSIWFQIIQNSSGQVSPFSAQYASLYLSDPTNSVGYIQAGRLYMAEDWTPVNNFDFDNNSLGWVDPTIIDTSLSGVEYYDPRTKYREAIFTLKYMSKVEGITKALRLALNRGVSADMLFVYNPSDGELMQQRSFIGRMEVLNPLIFTDVLFTSMAFKIKELV